MKNFNTPESFGRTISTKEMLADFYLKRENLRLPCYLPDMFFLINQHRNRNKKVQSVFEIFL